MTAVPFPASRELFRFCRLVAENQSGGRRVSDAEIGRVVGFESARTSRWKHGTIAVDDAARLDQLSEELEIDMVLLVCIVTGEMTVDRALEIHSEPSAFLEFVSGKFKLPKDGMGVDIIASPGGHARLKRFGRKQYQRHTALQSADGRPTGLRRAAVLLVDDDEKTAATFSNIISGIPGIELHISADAVRGLIMAGKLRPNLIFFDVFMPGMDGFAALRALKRDASTAPSYLVATVASLSSELVPKLLGSGADEVLSRPLNQRHIGKLVSKIS